MTTPINHGRPSDPKAAKFHKLLYEDEMIDLNQLKMIAWSGIPFKYRPLSWRLLLGYLPVSKSKREQQMKRKREEYDRLIEQYYNDRSLDDGMWRQIHIDIPRMQPLIPIFQQPRVQESFERILYIWSIRHPASGYVQGMNDLVTPFFLTYLSEFCETNPAQDPQKAHQSATLQDVEKFNISLIDDTQLRNIEADTYWSFGKLLDSIQINYTHAQPGIQRLIKMLATVVSRVDAELHNHLKSNGVDYLQFAFRWMNNLLIRELPLRLVVRLRDSYLAEGFLATFTPTNQGPPTIAYQSSSSSAAASANTTNSVGGGGGTNNGPQSVMGPGGLQNSGDISHHQHQINHQTFRQNQARSASSSSNNSLGIVGDSSSVHLQASANTGSSLGPTKAQASGTSSTHSTSSWNTGSETPFSASFHLFVCAAFLKSWSKQLMREHDFQGIMLLLQNLPTYHWSDQEIVLMLADAYHLKETFSPSHLRI